MNHPASQVEHLLYFTCAMNLKDEVIMTFSPDGSQCPLVLQVVETKMKSNDFSLNRKY